MVIIACSARFRLDLHKILVLKDTPAHICPDCGEIMLADAVMQKVDEAIERTRGQNAELEVLRYAA
jgi:hypothetical protein